MGKAEKQYQEAYISQDRIMLQTRLIWSYRCHAINIQSNSNVMQRPALCSSARKIKQSPASDSPSQPAWQPHLQSHSGKHNEMRRSTSKSSRFVMKVLWLHRNTCIKKENSILSAYCSLITLRGKQHNKYLMHVFEWGSVQHGINEREPNIAHNNQTLHTRPIYISEGFSWRGGAAHFKREDIHCCEPFGLHKIPCSELGSLK